MSGPTFHDFKKAVRQLKKDSADPMKLYALLPTKDGVKQYGPGHIEQIFNQWQEDIKKSGD